METVEKFMGAFVVVGAFAFLSITLTRLVICFYRVFKLNLMRVDALEAKVTSLSHYLHVDIEVELDEREGWKTATLTTWKERDEKLRKERRDRDLARAEELKPNQEEP